MSVKSKPHGKTRGEDRALCLINQAQDFLKDSPVRAAVERMQLGACKVLALRQAVSVPASQKVFMEKASDFCVFDPQHHVVPGGVVLAEVDAADVGDAVINHDQFFMIAGYATTRRNTEGVAMLYVYAAALQACMKLPGCLYLLTEDLIKQV